VQREREQMRLSLALHSTFLQLVLLLLSLLNSGRRRRPSRAAASPISPAWPFSSKIAGYADAVNTADRYSPRGVDSSDEWPRWLDQPDVGTS